MWSLSVSFLLSLIFFTVWAPVLPPATCGCQGWSFLPFLRRKGGRLCWTREKLDWRDKKRRVETKCKLPAHGMLWARFAAEVMSSSSTNQNAEKCILTLSEVKWNVVKKAQESSWLNACQVEQGQCEVIRPLSMHVLYRIQKTFHSKCVTMRSPRGFCTELYRTVLQQV